MMKCSYNTTSHLLVHQEIMIVEVHIIDDFLFYKYINVKKKKSLNVNDDY